MSLTHRTFSNSLFLCKHGVFVDLLLSSSGPYFHPETPLYCLCTKWLSGEALKIAVRRREAKSKGEKERYKHLNAEFQRIARRDKKGFFSDQCKEIEENNRMGKNRDLKKIRDTKGTFHAKMGSINDSNGMVFTEAEDIKKRWQEYTEGYKRIHRRVQKGSS